MMLVFLFTYVFSFFLSIALHMISIHQFALSALLQPELNYIDNEGLTAAVNTVAEIAGDKFRTFRHGAVHGLIYGIMVALPVLGINALFEGKGWKYILINAGYWVVCLSIMGGIICQWA